MCRSTIAPSQPGCREEQATHHRRRGAAGRMLPLLLIVAVSLELWLADAVSGGQWCGGPYPTVSCGQVVHGRWSATDCTTAFEPDGRSDTYDFDVSPGERVLVELSSAGADAYLELMWSFGGGTADDNSGPGTDARLWWEIPPDDREPVWLTAVGYPLDGGWGFTEPDYTMRITCGVDPPVDPPEPSPPSPRARHKPAAPLDLTAEPISKTALRIAWRSGSSDATAFHLEMRAEGEAGFSEIAKLGRHRTSATLVGLDPGSFCALRMRASNQHGSSSYSNVAAGLTLDDVTPCVAGPEALCLGDGRFRVRATWRTAEGEWGSGRAEALTEDTGYFWFFDPANVETIVKVLDGCAANERYWVFAAGLTNVQVDLTVVDTHTGLGRAYVNQQRHAYKPLQEVNAFACP
jgi:hypothetical protein